MSTAKEALQRDESIPVMISISDVTEANGIQWVLDDPQLSAKHLRIYTVIYENEEEDHVEYLVYAEDLSRYGTYWNESLIGKGNGGFLISHDDKLRLSSKTSFRFVIPNLRPARDHFDLEQETEMIHFCDEYVITDRLLGEGTFGRVFMGIEQRARRQVACKVVDLRKLIHSVSRHFEVPTKPGRAQDVDQTAELQKIKLWARDQKKHSQLDEQLKAHYREVNILSQLNHPNIIRLDKVYVTDSTLYIFQDLITAGDLFSYLESKNGRLLEIEAAVIIRQILIAVKFLHDQNVVHRDLKPENIMMTSLSAGCRVVLTDFGAAIRLRHNQRMESIIGSEQYAAPEIKKIARKGSCVQTGYTKAVDMWSIGAITVVLLTGGSAFSDPSTGSYSPLLARTCNLDSLKKTNEWSLIRAGPRDFIVNLLMLDENRRMTAQQALQHHWFSNEIYKVDLEELYQRTIKNWYPRVARSPVVEFIRSKFVRYLTSSQVVAGTNNRPRQEPKPVEPPYRPFPSNMHLPLWPKRRSISQIMSKEVETAIENVWNGNTNKNLPRLSPFTAANQTVHGRNSTQSKRAKVSHRAATSATKVRPKLARTLSLPLRGVPPPPKNTTSEQQNMVTRNHSLKATPTAIPENENNQVEDYAVESLTLDTLPVNAFEAGPPATLRRGLSRRPSGSGAGAAPQKRWRDSMFELSIDEESSVNETDGDGLLHTTFKRPRLSASYESGSEVVIEPDVVPHYPRALFGAEAAD